MTDLGFHKALHRDARKSLLLPEKQLKARGWTKCEQVVKNNTYSHSGLMGKTLKTS